MMDLFSANVQWRESGWLWLCLWPLLWLLLASLRRFWRSPVIDAHLLPWMQIGDVKGVWRNIFIAVSSILAWLLLVIALAGPRQAEYLYDKQSLAVRDVVIVLDVSYSMSASDVEPKRLQRAILEIQSLLAKSRYTRYGLVVYAGRAHLLAPLSSDTRLISGYLESIENKLLPSAGSDMFAALQLAIHELGQSQKNSRAIWILSDGELDQAMDSLQSQWDSLQQTLRTQEIKVFSTGVGSESGTTLIGKQGWMQQNGEQLITRLEPHWLQQLAQLSGGHYVKAEAGDGDRQTIYEKGIAKMAMPFDEHLSKSALHWQTLHQPYLLSGVIILFLGFFTPGKLRGFALQGALPVLMLLMLSGSNSLYAANSALKHKAHDYYSQKQYAQAEHAYAQVSGYNGRFGQGSSAYRQENYSLAIEQFTLAFLKAEDGGQRAAALFNLANSYFQMGDYKKAAKIYADVQRYQPLFSGAQSNRELALALQAEVDKFIMEPITPRSGRGPRTARVEQDIAVNDSGLTLADEVQVEFTGYVPLSQEQLYQLVMRGAEFQIHSANTQVQDEDYQWLITQQLNLSQAQQRIVSYRDGFVFWRNLFEYEEGFPAPVDEPVRLPGQTPW